MLDVDAFSAAVIGWLDYFLDHKMGCQVGTERFISSGMATEDEGASRCHVSDG
jgi:hypothetical protein